MMPTFPPLSLKFRTAGFPQYGFKAGYQTAPSRRQRVLRVVRFASVLRAPCWPAPDPRSKSRNAGAGYTSVQAAIALLNTGISYLVDLASGDVVQLVRTLPSNRHP